MDKTRWLGIIGYPLSHTLSPLMQNAAFESLGLDYSYIPLEVRPVGLGSAVEALRSLGFRGFNVTIPHKRSIIPFLDHLTPEARFIGAVNTVVFHRGRLTGHNTDGRGFIIALREEADFSPKKKKALVLGAGGSARAVAYQLLRKGAAEVMVANRSMGRARVLVDDLRKVVARGKVALIPWGMDSLKSAAASADLVVNATSVGMKTGDSSLLPSVFFRKGHVVFDLVYRPSETPLMKQARKAGALSINGLGMLVHQGALAFELWSSHKPSIERMRDVLME